MEAVVNFLKIAAVIVASLITLVFLVLIIVARIGCPIQKCVGLDGDIWMIPLFFSVVGVPAVLILAATLFFSSRR
ncbi:hypothetical protein [Rhizobium lusitanum]|uniref:Uncharacterized protein n=1 Tax=Rhizobium lusitanum TaxID=293958 RepID=A0A7X0IQ23_9HYPH|nr:hypothetical protein [Rhizobium lusitanum]MBB6485058.1 hypothetical protein [Rhizobium lusitanum]